MSLFSSIPFANETVYQIEFHRKTVPRFKKKQNLAKSNIFPEKCPFDNGHDVFKNMECFRQKIADENGEVTAQKYLAQPLNQQIVQKTLQDLMKTSYDNDYNKSEDTKEKVRKKMNGLPAGWLIPTTTQQVSYRPPAIWGGNLNPSLPILPTHNLTSNLKEREILRVTTGESDYMAEIGSTGAKLLKEKRLKKS